MRLSSLVYFYRLRLRTRWVQELFALVGIAVGVALLFAGYVANSSLTGSVRQLLDGTLGKAELQVTARDPGGLDADLLPRIRAIPGVKVAAPLLEVHANVVGPKGRRSLTLMGADTSLTQLDGRLTRRYRRTRLPIERIVALPAPMARAIGVSIGSPLRFEVGGAARRARLSLELDESDIGSLTKSPIAVCPLRYAQKLSDMRGRITRILIEPSAGQADVVARSLQSLVGAGIDVKPAKFDLALFEQASAPTNQSTALFAAISALVGFLFAFNAMLLTLPDRRNLVEALRVDGYAPFAVVKVVLYDALVLGIVASAVGLGLGELISRGLFEAKPGYLSFAFAVGDQRIVQWQHVAVAVAGGIVAPVLAAALSLRSLTNDGHSSGVTRFGDAPRDRVVQLLYVGLGCLVSSLVLAWLVSDVAFLAVTLLLAALMLILPAVLYATLELATKVLGPIRSAVPMISLGELRSMPTRSIAVTATGAIAVFGSVSILGARGDLQRGLDRSTHDVNAYADVWVAPIGATNMLSTTPFGGDAAQRIGALSNVRAVRPYHGGFLDVGDRRVWVIAPSADARRIVPESQILHGDLGQTNRRLREGGWAIVSEAVATEAHVTPGDRFTVPSPHPVSLRVAAISTNLGWPPGALLLNGRDYRHAWGNPEPTAYHVLLAAGVPPERGRSEIQRALDDESALLAETRSERESRHHALSRQALQRLSQLGTLVVIAAALAMAAATGGMVWQRRRRLAALKLDGFDDGTVWRALLLESALLLGTGCLAGALLGLCGQQLLDRQLATVTGFPVVHTVSVGLALVSFALVTAVAVTIAGLPGYLAARVAPSTALQD